MSQPAMKQGSVPLNVLIIEDSQEDADLIVQELRRGGYDPVCRWVDTAEAMEQALEERSWDLALSDFPMPRFSLAEALAIVRRRGLELPFVIVSASIGEEAAVEAIRSGARDYILKHRMARLVPAVRRELRESELRRERRNLEEQSHHAQKLESLGLLAGGVAHDFNNLLTGILGNASLLLDMLDGDPDAHDMLDEIIRAGERAADLTRQLLAYAGKGKFVVGPVDISSLVRDLSDLIRSSVPHTVELALALDTAVPAVEGDASQIQQVVMNVILNAVEATGERPGTVRVSTGIREVGPGDEVAHFLPEPPAPGTYVAVEVVDDGCGMSEAVKAQIFDPFFTTKFTGRGLGLAAVLGIVRGHSGAIAVESRPGAGSTFTVLFPASTQAVAIPKTGTAPMGKAQPGAGAILIVDDEEHVRHTARAALERCGYTVFEASDGQDGVDLFTRLHDRLSAVLLDLTMPRMDGLAVWRYIRRVRPDMTVVLSSGFEESDAMQHFAGDPELRFIHKPYTAAALAEKIRGAVARKRS